MKNLSIFIITLFFIIKGYSQCDNPYYSLEEGLSLAYEMYNSKDKYEGKIVKEIIDIKETSNGVEWTFKITSYNKKDKLESENEISFTCEDGVVKKDLSSIIPEDLLASFEGLETSMECDDMKFPKSLSVGQSLPDGKCKISASMGGGMNMSMTFITDERKVLSKEDITTKAGTFNTFKITQSNHYSMNMPMMNTNNKELGKSLTWITEEVGMVKSEEYNKKGELETYTILTSFEQP